MTQLHWCMLGVTAMLLMCEVAIGHLCKSLITVVDGFHTLFILMHMALPPPETAAIRKPPLPSVEPPNNSPLGTKTQAVSDQPPTAPLDHAANFLSRLSSPNISPAVPPCGLSFSRSRIQVVGVFLSTLLLTSLCISYLLQIVGYFLDPHPMQHPLLPLVVGALSLLHKMLVFVLNSSQQHEQAEGSDPPADETRLQFRKKDAQIASEVCREWKSLLGKHPACRLSPASVLPGLFTSLLVLINSLVLLLIAPQLPHSSEDFSPLVCLDPALSLLAVITLIASSLLQVYKYGLLLLQATPPHICVHDVGRRIESVPGVQAMHDLHIWQLNESLAVASVHVQCRAGFPTCRCVDVTSGVTEVLHSVGVRCCTVQPEFVSASGSADDSPVTERTPVILLS